MTPMTACCRHCGLPESSHVQARPRLRLCPSGPLRVFDADRPVTGHRRFGGGKVQKVLAEIRASLAVRRRLHP